MGCPSGLYLCHGNIPFPPKINVNPEKLKFEQGNDGMSFGFVFNMPSPPKINTNPELFTIDTKPQVQMLQMSMAPWISQSS
jgi:hypothetical protein